MKNKFSILLIVSYLLAFSVNLMPSLKYPDVNVNIFHLLATLLFIFLLLMYSKKGSKTLKVFSIVGVVSGVLIFVVKTFENAMLENAILDAIASIQYPLFLIFTTPIFGGNILFNLSYGSYSLLMSLFYGAVLCLTLYFKKNVTRTV
jgi:hypothetical protein